MEKTAVPAGFAALTGFSVKAVGIGGSMARFDDTFLTGLLIFMSSQI